MADAIQKMNDEVNGWRNDTLSSLKKEITDLGIGHNPKADYRPAKSVMTARSGKKYGIVNRVSFKFPRYMVFVHKGVSRKHPISNPREAKEWFNPVIDRKIESLAEIVAENTGDQLVETAFEKLKIK